MAFHWQSKNIANVGVEDLVLLSKVQENAISENLQKRYQANLIYTFIGPSLVAVNPYKKLNCFTEKELQQYHGSQAYENPPHIYAVAERMWQNLVSDDENQCVIISGESGAGKTESAKLIMSYIAEVSPRENSTYGSVVDDIKHIILESNPLLESFGNAKTVRNNNSSRFGKYFEIRFSRSGVPVGGKISNFLLEKSRVVSVQEGERNFHIFYQLLHGSVPGNLKQRLGLSNLTPADFSILKTSSHYEAEGIDDGDEYKAMRHAMGICQIPEHDQESILDLIGAILHLGNVEFQESEGGGDNNASAKVVDPGNSLAYSLNLLGLPSIEDFCDKLTSRVMKTGGIGGKRNSMYKVPLNSYQASATRDALSKALYSRLFDYIVEAVNGSLSGLSSKMRIEYFLSFGVLDIYGFEIFSKNGFEQFCINYVNERLQQIFIDLTLRQEQEEYVQEGIQWTPIDYFNNKIVVDLIEAKKPPGIMAILDDACFTLHAVSEGVDNHFLQKLGGAVSGHPHFASNSSSFTVKHYAGNVTYTVQGFTEANKDTLFKDLVQLMQTTQSAFIRKLFPEEIDWEDRKRPTTASHKIRSQCQDLVTTLTRCVPSYVRCIKPNDSKRPGDFDDKRVEHQIRYLNLKENIRVRRAGFCYRAPFEKFVRRYGIVSDSVYFNSVDLPFNKSIELICQAAEMPSGEYQLGRTKLFIRSPECLFQLEEIRDRKYDVFARRIQACWRRYSARKNFLQMKKQATNIFMNRKERRRLTLNRTFVGDYLGARENPAFKQFLTAKNETIVVSDSIVKFDREMKQSNWELLLTPLGLYFIGMEKCKENGLNKGKLVRVLKRKVEYSQIEKVMLSSKSDDFIALSVRRSYGQLFRCVVKTELVVAMATQYQQAMHSPLPLEISDVLKYSVKKTTWQSAATISLNVQIGLQIEESSPPLLTKVQAHAYQAHTAAGLPGTTQPTQTSLPSFRKRRDGAAQGRVVAPMFRCYKSSANGNNSNAVNAKATPKLGSATSIDSFAKGSSNLQPSVASLASSRAPPATNTVEISDGLRAGTVKGAAFKLNGSGIVSSPLKNPIESNASDASLGYANSRVASNGSLAATVPKAIAAPSGGNEGLAKNLASQLKSRFPASGNQLGSDGSARSNAVSENAAEADNTAPLGKTRGIVGGVATPMAFGAGSAGLKKTGFGNKLTDGGSFGSGSNSSTNFGNHPAPSVSSSNAPPKGSAPISSRRISVTQAPDESLVVAAHKKAAPPLPAPVKKPLLGQVRALYQYDARDKDEISIKAGDIISLVAKDDPGWWVGTLNGKKGMFPANYVESA